MPHKGLQNIHVHVLAGLVGSFLIMACANIVKIILFYTLSYKNMMICFVYSIFILIFVAYSEDEC